MRLLGDENQIHGGWRPGCPVGRGLLRKLPAPFWPHGKGRDRGGPNPTRLGITRVFCDAFSSREGPSTANPRISVRAGTQGEAQGSPSLQVSWLDTGPRLCPWPAAPSLWATGHGGCRRRG